MTRPGGSAGHATPERHDDRVVPVYAVTGGRTRSAGPDLPVESLVVATDRWTADLQKEHRMIVELAARPVSLIEVGARLRVPVGVARVLVSDLADAGFLTVHTPPRSADGGPTPAMLQRLLDGLRAH
ncbi:DUF742 domain-containing protein [Pseudonocardia alaniniphila]|uniref:DUF742 domain-containing protein n=1 Tax=Pseudonocardia alaniniphila TaxID=75291 RepID=A0ABS9TJD8_9PSEU|nr:DUF742 domain-containing protein [Pseudonocardia alaniniphila]MCH6168641.1 DUF742 domain-containing protein [Pseudonocardia alaniniphila]